MDLTSGLVLGRVRGIEIRVHWSWLLIFGLLSYSLAEGFFGEAFEEWTATQRWTASIVTSVLFFVSVLVHELSHAFVAQRYGMEVPSITLFIFGGAVIQGFVFAMIWGVIVGTYSSIFIAAPLLIVLGLGNRHRSGEDQGTAQTSS